VSARKAATTRVCFTSVANLPENETDFPPGVPRPGEMIAGRYLLERVIGQGGMGVVMAGRHVALKRPVAVKFLLPDALRLPDATERFLREAQSAAAIQNEHVARVLDVGTAESGAPFMVMELLTGVDFGQILKARGAMAVSDAVDSLLQACEAIAEAHALGIIHRDLKPQNFFLTQRPDGTSLVKVLDFGLSTARHEGDSAPRNLTRTQMVAGTPDYMSPEQVRSLKNVDGRSDVWALGVILYEMLCTRRPFEGETVTAVHAAIVADPPVALGMRQPALPPGLCAAVMACLEKDPGRRFQSIGELGRAILPFGSGAARASVERIASTLGQNAGRLPVAPRGAAAEAVTLAAPALQAMPVPPLRPELSAPLRPELSRVGPRARSPMEDVQIDLGPGTPRPSFRPAPLRPATDVELGADLRAPVKLLILAVLLAGANMAATRIVGQPLQLGPVRLVWLAGLLAVAAVLLGAWRLLSASGGGSS
jgi:serine/threonine protein kinase